MEIKILPDRLFESLQASSEGVIKKAPPFGEA